MGMVAWCALHGSNWFIIVISPWSFSNHSCVEPTHKLFVFFSTVITCAIFPHHICDYSSFCYSEVFYMFVAWFISTFDLSNDRQYIYWVNMDDFYGFVALSITAKNGKGHSCQEEKFHERGATMVAAFGEMFLSGLHRCEFFMGRSGSALSGFRGWGWRPPAARLPFTMCLSMDGSRANLPAYPYTA